MDREICIELADIARRLGEFAKSASDRNARFAIRAGGQLWWNAACMKDFLISAISERPALREAAIVTLSRIGGVALKEAIPSLISVLARGGNQPDHAQETAATALGLTDDGSAVSALTDAVANFPRDSDVTTAAIDALGRLGPLAAGSARVLAGRLVLTDPNIHNLIHALDAIETTDSFVVSALKLLRTDAEPKDPELAAEAAALERKIASKSGE